MQRLKQEYGNVAARLAESGLRPTRQRILLGSLLLEKGCRHVTAEELFQEAGSAGMKVSLATVYNALHQFTGAGLLKEIMLEGGPSCFDTNTAPHHHFFCEETGRMEDIPADAIALSGLPAPPPGREICGVDIFVRVRPHSLPPISCEEPAPPSGESRRARIPKG